MMAEPMGATNKPPPSDKGHHKGSHLNHHGESLEHLPGESVKVIAQSVGIDALSDEVARALAPDVEYRLREVIQDACKFMRHSKRVELSTEDVNSSLRLRNVEALYGFPAGAGPLEFNEVPGQPGLFYQEDREVDLKVRAVDASAGRDETSNVTRAIVTSDAPNPLCVRCVQRERRRRRPVCRPRERRAREPVVVFHHSPNVTLGTFHLVVGSDCQPTRASSGGSIRERWRLIGASRSGWSPRDSNLTARSPPAARDHPCAYRTSSPRSSPARPSP